MAFVRRSLEKILDDMVGWSRGVSTKITDFRIGSRVRTIYEAVGVQIEGLEDRVFKAIRIQIPENIYAIFDFSRIPAVYASGAYTFSRSTAASEDYTIPAGTLVYKPATSTDASVGFRTISDCTLATGNTTVTTGIICLLPGTIGNAAANTITDIPAKPSGVESGTNASSFFTGAEPETADEQKARFKRFIESLSRGTLQAVQYGASTAYLADAEGLITERVVQAKAVEYIPNRRGEVDIFIWNGSGTASSGLLAKVQQILLGYYDASGSAVIGYKPAGVQTFAISVSEKSVNIRLTVTPEDNTTLNALKPAIEAEIDRVFNEATIGGVLYQTASEAAIKYLDGVKDVKLEFSTDSGSTWGYDNVTPDADELVRPVKPLVYAG